MEVERKMLPFLWLLAWVIAFMVPVTQHWIREKWRYITLAGVGTLFGFIGIATATIDCYMVLLLVFMKLLLVAIELILAYMDSEYGEWKSIFKNKNKAYKWLTTLSLLALIIFSIMSLWQVGAVSGVNNAGVFQQMIEFQPAGTPIFQNEIANNMLRLTTEELAKSIALRNAAHFGSVQVGSAHITLYDNRLVWVVTMLSPNLMGDNTIKGYVVVDANNPEADVEIIDKVFRVGEGLIYFPPFYTGGIQGSAYWGISTSDAYGRATLTTDDNGEWKYVLTATNVEQWSFVTLPKGVYVYNEYGQVEEFYSMKDMPDWVTQRYDEGWLESMINAWGGHKRGDGFDVWAGGFLWIPASTNRVEMSDDTRWIIDPDSNQIVAIVSVDPVGQVQTMSGVFKATKEGILYYDVSTLGIKSGLQAQNVVGSHILKTTTGLFEPQMPLMYMINGRYAWFVPINWHVTEKEAQSEQETIKLAGLAIVDAVDLDHYSMVMTSEGYQGAALVAEAKRKFLSGEVVPQTEKTVSGTIEAKFSYVNNGNTIYVLTINGTKYKVDTQDLNFQVVSRIENLQVNEQTTIIVNTSDEFIRFPD